MTLHHCRLILETETESGTKSLFHYLQKNKKNSTIRFQTKNHLNPRHSNFLGYLGVQVQPVSNQTRLIVRYSDPLFESLLPFFSFGTGTRKYQTNILPGSQILGLICGCIPKNIGNWQP